MVDRARTMGTFCKPPCLLSKAGSGENHVQVNLAGDIFVSFPTDRGPSLAINTTVYLVFEVRLDGKPHDAPFGRLPLVGKFTDWRELSRLAVRMEWGTPNGCYATYLQALHPMEPGSEQALGPYVSASALLAALKGTVSTETSGWRLRIPAPRIIEFSFGHLSQTVHIRERVIREKRPGPQAREAQEINRELKNLGLNVTPTVPEELRHGEGRTTCDACYVVGSRCHRSGAYADVRWKQNLRGRAKSRKHDWPDAVGCTFSYGVTDHCDLCRDHGRPCTFTPSAELMRSNRWREVGIFPLEEEFFEIIAPQWHTVTALADTVGG
ncbi:MAG: hypothetical protein Q9207_001301 [Kuettlingeria erythrocarpa]